MKRNIHLVYEHIYRNKELPIGIDIDNPIIDDLLVKHNWEWHGPLIADYREKLGYNVPVFLNNLPIDMELFQEHHIYEFIDRRQGNIVGEDIYFFPIGVYGSFDNACGVNPEGENVINRLGSHTIDLINNQKNFFLLINHTDEGCFTKENVASIVSSAKNKKIKKGKIIYATACYNASNVFTKFLKELNTDYQIQTLYYNWALESCSKHWYNISKNFGYRFYQDITHIETIVLDKDVDSSRNTLRKNKFLSFNNKMREQRLFFLSIMNQLGELHTNSISYDITDLNLEWEVQNNVGKLKEIGHTDEEVEYFTQYKNLDVKKQTVDLDNIRDARGHGWDRKEIYLDSYINLTTETLFYDDCWYISEKMFKPIANLQPFIVMGSVYTLRELKKLGFKTFSSYWDESYDDEEDTVIRMRKLTEVITKISTMTIQQVHDMYNDMLPIIKFNQKKLFEYEIHKPNQKEFIKNLSNIHPDTESEVKEERGNGIL
jgi:hypothetical protein|tara:strand:- start:199 stop:1662 length:1464 start_codon:yes stop_codon:yes gene_type:complete